MAACRMSGPGRVRSHGRTSRRPPAESHAEASERQPRRTAAPARSESRPGCCATCGSPPPRSSRAAATSRSRCWASWPSTSAPTRRSACRWRRGWSACSPASGDSVTEGQALLELQSTDVGRARSDYPRPSAHLTLAESALKRKRDLAAERIAPQREVQEAEAAAAAAREERACRSSGAAARWALPRLDEGDADSRRLVDLHAASPVRGTVIERTAMRGQMLEPGSRGVPHRRPVDAVADRARLRAGRRARFDRAPRRGSRSRRCPGRSFTGNVTLVGRQVSSESRTIDVRIEVRNRGQLLRPGMSASAALPIGVSNTPILAVPVAAVQRVGDSWCVFVPEGRGRLRDSARSAAAGTWAPKSRCCRASAPARPIVVDGAFLLKSQAEKRDAGHGDH